MRAERYGDSSAGSCEDEGSCRAGPILPIWVCEAARRGLTDHNRPLLGVELALIERAPPTPVDDHRLGRASTLSCGAAGDRNVGPPREPTFP